MLALPRLPKIAVVELRVTFSGKRMLLEALARAATGMTEALHVVPVAVRYWIVVSSCERRRLQRWSLWPADEPH